MTKHLTRRQFFKVAGTTAAVASFPTVLQEALAIPANNVTGTIEDVQHVVILMQENRSFDHYFGTMSGVRGFGDRFPIPLASGKPVWYQRPAPPATDDLIPYHLDSSIGNAQRVTGTPHSWLDMHFAWNEGRTGLWPAFKQPQSMGYYQEAEIPFQFALANAFTICDHYHASMLSSTNPNRLFLFTGTNNPSGVGGGPAIDNTNDDLGPSASGYSWTTYAERLQAAGISWKVYQDMNDNFTDNSLEGFVNFRKAYENRVAEPGNELLTRGLTTTLSNNSLEGFKNDVINKSLPQVSYIVAPAAYSEHTGPSSPVQGAWYTQQVIEALISDPDTWAKTVLIVNFDENDGFFDHVPPPCAPTIRPDGSMAGASTVDTTTERRTVNHQVYDKDWVYGPGVRVPCFVVSPFSRGGWVNSQTFDHTSVVQFLEQRFKVKEPNISAYRRAVCGDLTSCFNFVTPNTNSFPSLPKFTKAQADQLRSEQEKLAQVASTNTMLPKQVIGIRPSRALPYELHVSTRQTTPGFIDLSFHNSGRQGAVFHVYDMKRLVDIPQRYIVESCKSLSARWSTVLSAGEYDLFVLGPNNFHRRITGSTINALLSGQSEVDVCYDIGLNKILMNLVNQATSPLNFVVTDKAYQQGSRTITVPAGKMIELPWDLKPSGSWYDLQVTVKEDLTFTRRFAGRMETGSDSITDPAMGITKI